MLPVIRPYRNRGLRSAVVAGRMPVAYNGRLVKPDLADYRCNNHSARVPGIVARRVGDRIASIRELRIVVSFDDQFRSLCKLAFTKVDASIYVIPYAPTQKYSVGTQRLREDVHSITFNLDGAQDYETAPKISFHESGQVHATPAMRGSVHFGYRPLQTGVARTWQRC